MQWAVLGSNQCGPRSAVSRPDLKTADLQALFSPVREAPIGREQVFAGSRVVTQWSSGVARSENGQRLLHLGCICVSACLGFVVVAGC